MSQQEEVDKLDFPFVAELGEMILSDILYRDGLDQLPGIASLLAAISGSLSSIALSLEEINASTKEIARCTYEGTHNTRILRVSQ